MAIKKSESKMFGKRYFTKNDGAEIIKELDEKWAPRKIADITYGEWEDRSKEAKADAKRYREATGGISHANLLLLGIYGGAALIWGGAMGVVVLAEKISNKLETLKNPVWVQLRAGDAHHVSRVLIRTKQELRLYTDCSDYEYTFDPDFNWWSGTYEEAIKFQKTVDKTRAAAKINEAVKGKKK